MDIDNIKRHQPMVIAEEIADHLSRLWEPSICRHIDALLDEGRLCDALVWAIELEARLHFGAIGEFWCKGGEYRRTAEYKRHVAERLIGSIGAIAPAAIDEGAKRAVFESAPGRAWQVEE